MRNDAYLGTQAIEAVKGQSTREDTIIRRLDETLKEMSLAHELCDLLLGLEPIVLEKEEQPSGKLGDIEVLAGLLLSSATRMRDKIEAVLDRIGS